MHNASTLAAAGTRIAAQAAVTMLAASYNSNTHQHCRTMHTTYTILHLKHQVQSHTDTAGQQQASNWYNQAYKPVPHPHAHAYSLRPAACAGRRRLPLPPLQPPAGTAPRPPGAPGAWGQPRCRSWSRGLPACQACGADGVGSRNVVVAVEANKGIAGAARARKDVEVTEKLMARGKQGSSFDNHFASRSSTHTTVVHDAGRRTAT
jgi:hypothetical protein